MDFNKAWEIIKKFGDGDTLEGIEKVMTSNINTYKDVSVKEELEIKDAYFIVVDGMSELLAPIPTDD